MKIAVIRKECTFRKGGAERYAANLCRRLALGGHQVFVLAKEFDPEVHPDIRHIRVPVDGFTSGRKNTSFHENCQRLLRGLDVDVVYALSRTYPADAFRVSDPLHAAWMDIRYAGLERVLQGINPRHRSLLRLERNIVDAAHTRCIITNSELAKSQILEHYPYPGERIHVVYNGVDLEKFRPDEDRRERGASTELKILFVGQDFKRKGLELLLEAGRRLKGEIPFRIAVVGKDRTERFRKMCEGMGISDRVSFHGATPEIERHYREADLFVFPSRYDPFANVCLEAMACGLPVMTTASNGASEIVEEGENGYVLSPDRPLAENIAETVRRFAALEEGQRATMRRCARKKAERFTIARNMDRTIEILESL